MIEGLNPRLIFAIAFVTGILAVLYIDRNKIERHSILFIRRTQRGIDLLDSIAKKAPRFWNIYGWIGVFFALISIPLMVFQMGWIVNNFIQTGSSEGGPSAILPGLTSDTTVGGNLEAGVTFIPVEYWVISIAIIMIVHEASHGIIARMEDFEINSVGWLVLGIIPGAFVEPKGMKLGEDDEDEGLGAAEIWDQGTYKQRLKVLAAGSWANYLTAAVFGAGYIALIAFILPAFFSGAVQYDAIDGYPAAEAGMNSGTLTTINGQEVQSADEIQSILNGTSPGDTINLVSSEGEFEFELGEREGLETGFIGITFSYPYYITWFVNLFAMIAFLNVAIGMFNMLPAKPLDGGHILDTLIEGFGKEEQRKYVNYFSVLMWIIVLGSLITALIL
ncbi:MAG: site-2 protease family protein [Candidatus Nanohaloarchaea archaeon]